MPTLCSLFPTFIVQGQKKNILSNSNEELEKSQQVPRRVNGWVFLHLPPRQSPAQSLNGNSNPILP